nr:TPA_asm: hypothetical protein [Arceuthobium sichuanense virus 4]
MASTSRALFAPPSDAELQDQLDSALEPMGEYLPDMRQYTVKSVNENNYTVESFIKAMRPLVSYCVQGTFDRILGAGSTMGVVKRVTKPTTADLINLSYWVRSKQGQGVLTTINVQRKLEKKAGAGKTAADMAWTSIYAYQQTDWARERRAIQNDADVKLDKLRLKMAKIQSKADAEIAVVDKRYPVQSQFAVANRGEFGNLCWAMYQKDCVDKGIRPKKKKDHRLGEAVRTYSTIVRDELIGDYCQMAQVRKELERYAKAKIAGFNREGNRGAATPFRNLLAASAGTAFVSAASQIEETTSGENSSGDSEPEGEPSHIDDVVSDALFGQAEGKNFIRPQADKGDASSGGARKKLRSFKHRKSQGKSVKEDRSSSMSPDTSRPQ